MSQQEFHQSRRQDDEPGPGPGPLPTGGSAAAQESGLDDILDEIDAVLETNAQEFVQGFVQKGGQ